MKSPSVEMCIFDGRTGWCRACGRTKDECCGWKKAHPHQQRRVVAELARRLDKLTKR